MSSTVAAPAKPDTKTVGRSTGLRRGTIGLVGLATLGAVMMSPAMGIYATWGPMAGIVGEATPLVFLAALVITIPTGLSYSVISRTMPTAGSAFTWVWNALSPSVGTWVGLIMVLYYTIALVIQPILFGLFFNDLLSYIGVGGIGLGTWAIGAALLLIPLGFFVSRGVEFSVEAALTMVLIETGVLLALVVTIMINKLINGGFSFAPLEPSHVTGGWNGLYQGLLLGIFAYTGFDVVSTAAEEAKAPRRLLPRATLFALLGVGVFWTFASWGLSMSEPVSKISAFNLAGTTAVTPLAGDFWGWGRIFVIITAMTAITAVSVATTIGASRGLYAMARERVIPSRLAKTHPVYQVPRIATATVLLVAGVGAFSVVFILDNAVDGLIWWASAIVFFALVTYAAVNLANLVLFRTSRRAEFNWLLNGVVPVLGLGIDVFLLYKSFFKTLWEAGWRTGQSVIVVSLALAAIAVAVAVFNRLRRPDQLTHHAYDLDGALEAESQS
jgi:amino acid transporter